jgi:hypothetical protein
MVNPLQHGEYEYHRSLTLRNLVNFNSFFHLERISGTSATSSIFELVSHMDHEIQLNN